MQFTFIEYCLKDQIRRAAVSIPSNIAEGDERATDKAAVRYFYIAKGSSAEVLTQATIAFEIGYIQQETFTRTISTGLHFASREKITSAMLKLRKGINVRQHVPIEVEK